MSATRIQILGRVGRLAATLAVAGGTVTVASIALAHNYSSESPRTPQGA